jgi:hypothetical protein
MPEGEPMTVSYLLRALLTGVFLVLLTLPPAPTNAAPLAHDPVFAASLMSPPPQSLCPGDQVALTIFIFDKAHSVPAAGYPVNVTHDPNIGELDPISKVITNGTVNFIYKAHDNPGNAAKTDVLVFRTGGYPTGLQVPIRIADCSDYKFSFLMEQHKTQDFIELYTYFSGESTATRFKGQLTGAETGSSAVFLSLGGETEIFSCKLDPPIQGNGVFTTDGVINRQGPDHDLLTVSFTFERIKLNDALLYCKTNDLMASYPFQVDGWDPSESGLEGLQVPMIHNTGSIPISHKEMTGMLTVWREKK